MEIEAFLLCDAATDQQGKLNILGVFDSFFSNKVPVTVRAFSIATRIRFEKIEDGDNLIRIHIIDQDGNSIGPRLEGGVSVKSGPDSDSIMSNLILNIQRLKFEQYGIYRIDLAIDGKIKASVPLRVTKSSSKE